MDAYHPSRFQIVVSGPNPPTPPVVWKGRRRQNAERMFGSVLVAWNQDHTVTLFDNYQQRVVCQEKPQGASNAYR